MTKVSHDSETPAHGQQVITAVAFIHHDFDGVTKVFMPKRAHTKKFYPGVYELPGGHIDFGEDIIEGLKREIKEELGKEIEVGEVFDAFTYLNQVKGAHAIEVVFFAQFTGGIDNVRLAPDDHSDAQWFSEDQAVEYNVKSTPDDREAIVVKRGFEVLRRLGH